MISVQGNFCLTRVKVVLSGSSTLSQLFFQESFCYLLLLGEVLFFLKKMNLSPLFYGAAECRLLCFHSVASNPLQNSTTRQVHTVFSSNSYSQVPLHGRYLQISDFSFGKKDRHFLQVILRRKSKGCHVWRTMTFILKRFNDG